ncbi:MAG: leucine-rich repeat domain-containing protein [Clostridia bacterium]|nr:leucine-rich repeat domain-containing protein [Clostridia bacterium]
MNEEEKRSVDPFTEKNSDADDPGKSRENTHDHRHLTSAERHAIYEERARKNVLTRNTKAKKKTIGLSAVISVSAVIVIALAVTLVFLNNNVWKPGKQYKNAVGLFENGYYLKAYDAFTALGDYNDCAEMAQKCILKNAQELSGRENVIVGSTAEMPWFSVNAENGELNYNEKKYRGGTDLVIPDVFDGVLIRRIAPNAFRYTDFSSVTIPASVTVIGERAFLGCDGITEIALSDNVTLLGESAFSGCSGLISLSIGKGLTSISQRAFKDCTSLVSVVIPEGITEIDSRAFNGCRSLKELYLPSTLVNVGGFAFSDCTAIEKITYPGTADDLAAACAAEGGDIIIKCPGLVCGD